jgi:hypothetical protein
VERGDKEQPETVVKVIAKNGVIYRQAERIERGVNINLNRKYFFTRLVHAEVQGGEERKTD